MSDREAEINKQKEIILLREQIVFKKILAEQQFENFWQNIFYAVSRKTFADEDNKQSNLGSDDKNDKFRPSSWRQYNPLRGLEYSLRLIAAMLIVIPYRLSEFFYEKLKSFGIPNPFRVLGEIYRAVVAVLVRCITTPIFFAINFLERGIREDVEILINAFKPVWNFFSAKLMPVPEQPQESKPEKVNLEVPDLGDPRASTVGSINNSDSPDKSLNGGPSKMSKLNNSGGQVSSDSSDSNDSLPEIYQWPFNNNTRKNVTFNKEVLVKTFEANRASVNVMKNPEGGFRWRG